jgi:hypothetical protein
MNGSVSVNDAFLMEYFEVFGEGIETQQTIAAGVSQNEYEF